MSLAKATFGNKDWVPELEEAGFLRLLFGWGIDVRVFVDGVELAALGWVEEDFGGFLYAFEEGVVF